MKIIRAILAVLVTILFLPIAVMLCFGIGLIMLPEMLIDCFDEVRGK